MSGENEWQVAGGEWQVTDATPLHPLTPTPAHPLTLRDAFPLRPKELVAFVGGGGKTSLLFTLGRELATAGKRVVGTTTTRIATAEVYRAPAFCLADDLSALGAKLRQHTFCLIVSGVGHEKAKSVPLDLPGRVLARVGVDVVLVEADGAKMLPVKAPAGHEPALPPDTTLLVPVAGIDALAGPIAQVAHRPQRVGQLTHQPTNQPLSPHTLATLLTHPQGGLKNAPAGARVIPFINKVETEAQLALARQVAEEIVRHPRIDRVVIGAAQTARPVRAVVEKPPS